MMLEPGAGAKKDHKMTLRKKTIYLLIAGVALLVLVLVLSSQVLVLRGFTDLETENIGVHMERWDSEVANRLARLNSIAGDWAPWDDTYHFMEDFNEAYVKNNLSLDTILNLRINFILFFDPAGELKFSLFCDLTGEQASPVLKDVVDAVMGAPVLLHHENSTSKADGIVMTNLFPVMVASQPILKSDFSGPMRGTLVVGRYLDRAEITHISETTHLAFTITRLVTGGMPPDFQEELADLSNGRPVVVQAGRAKTLAGYTLKTDIHGAPAFLVRVEVPRRIYAQGLKTLYYYILSLIGVGFLFVVLILIFMEKVVLSPLSRLSNEVGKIGKSGDTRERITWINRDELGRLATEINKMLDQIDAKNRELLETNRELTGEIVERKQAQAMIAESEKRLREQSRVIMKISRMPFLDKEDLQTALRQVTEAAAPTLGVERVGIWVNRDYRTVECFDLYLLSRGHHLTGMQLRMTDYPDYLRLLLEERAIAADDAVSDLRTQELAESVLKPLGITSLLHAAVHVEGKITGVVSFEHTGPMRRWTLDEQAFAASIADLVSLIMEAFEKQRTEAEKKALETRLQRAEKMEAIGMLAGGVAHDLNNILSGLVSYPDLLLMRIPEDSDLRKPLTVIKQSGERAGAVVQDLLTLARRGATMVEPVDLNRVVDDYLKSFAYEHLLSIYPGATVETDLDADLLSIQGSFVHLSKTVMNLVLNAAEAMPEGGNIHIVTRNQYVDQPLEAYDHTIEEGEYVVLSIADAGVGISEADRQRIFEPFYTKKVMGRSGTGLGLAVVWGTVRDMKGHIDVRPGKAGGTVFLLYFPAVRKPAPGISPSVPVADYRGQGETVLVVDDVAEQREIAADILQMLGYEAVAVDGGEAALAYLRDHSADLVMLDMIMEPGMDGLDTYRAILEIHPGQKAIITSGFSESDRVRIAMTLGVSQYVKKPYRLETLGLALRKALS